MFLNVWAASPINDHIDRSGALEENGRRNLDAISLKPRIAFLLQALEGFDLEQIGQTLQVTEHEAGALIEAANGEIADQIATDVLIIEDEPLIAHDLRSIVEELGHRVVGMPRTHAEALAAIRQGDPGLILADIQLADGSSGLDAVNGVLPRLSVHPGDLRHRLPRAVFDRRAARTGLSDRQTLQCRKPQGRHQSGAVFERRAGRREQSAPRVGMLNL